MQFRILGPIEVIGSTGQPCPLEPRQARLLAALLLAAPRTVTREYLIEALWDESPPVTVGQQLKNLISGLRRRLAEAGVGGPLIVFDGPGYRIRLAEARLDRLEFACGVAVASSMEDGQVADAVRELRSALALWRGPALAGYAGRTLQAAAARLDEERLAALEQCIDLELQLGRQHQVVAELTELVAGHPLRERLVGQLMIALHRSGRSADALDAFQRLRGRLAEDLGIDPSPALQALVIAFLAGAALLTIPSAAHAEPAGCWHQTFFWTDTFGAGTVLHGQSVGECSTSATRTLRVQLKSNQWPSDIVVTFADDHHYGWTFDIHVAACDDGATHEYYARGYYTQSVTWVDDGYETYTTCS